MSILLLTRKLPADRPKLKKVPRRWPLFLHSARHLHQPPAVVEVIFLLSRVSLDYRVRVAHLVAAARTGAELVNGAQNAILIDATTCDWRQKTCDSCIQKKFGEVIACCNHKLYQKYIILFIHHLDAIIDALITSLILIMFSFTLIAMSGPASTSHNIYLYSIVSENGSECHRKLVANYSTLPNPPHVPRDRRSYY